MTMPNGIPDRDPRERVVGTEQTVDAEARRQFQDSGSDATPAEAPGRAAGDRELPIPDYDELSVRGAKVRLDALNEDELRRLRLYESENKKRKTLIHEIDRRLR
jgi:hypothetical protein